jgi:hypothetical protein
MLVKRVLSNGTQRDVIEERPPQNDVKTSHKENLLKAVIGSEECTTRKLFVHLDSTSKVCCILAMKVFLSLCPFFLVSQLLFVYFTLKVCPFIVNDLE